MPNALYGLAAIGVRQLVLLFIDASKTAITGEAQQPCFSTTPGLGGIQMPSP